MTDPVTSGESTAQSASPESAAATNAASTPTPAFGVFAHTRGSGLARGKRPSQSAAPAAVATTGEYKPTALEVITPEREYKNPFSGETSTPRAEETPAPAAAPVTETPAVSDAANAPKPVAERPTWKPQPRESSEPKSELNILPPAEQKRTSVSWEKSQNDNRPNKRDSGQEGYKQRNPNDRPPFSPRGDRQEEAKPAAKKSGGFFAWLKGLFTGKKKTVETKSERSGNFDRDGGHGRRRRHRGNRGRSFNSDRQGGFQGSKPQGGERREGQYRGNFQKRHQSGPKRKDNSPRPEGQQGGGYI
jgi:hypothetical protein